MSFEETQCCCHRAAACWVAVFTLVCCFEVLSNQARITGDEEPISSALYDCSGKVFNQRSLSRGPIYEFVEGDWRLPVPGTSFDFYFDFTSQEDIPSHGSRTPYPLLVFSDQDLENPVFTTEAGFRNIRRRALMLWKKYKEIERISGLLIWMDRNHDTSADWVRRLAADLAAELDDVRIFSNCETLPRRSKEKELDLYPYWSTDDRLSRTTELLRDSKHRRVNVKGSYPGTTAIVAKGMVYHFTGATTLAVDIETSEEAGDGAKVFAFLRTAPETVYRSELVQLRYNDINRIHFPLDDPYIWFDWIDPESQPSPYELLNIHEIGLRFYVDDDTDVSFRVGPVRLLGPSITEEDLRAPLAFETLDDRPGKVLQYSKLEFDFRLNRVFNNPYDPDEIDVTLELKAPDGKVLIHPGYFHEPWRVELCEERETLLPGGEPLWRVRFTPWLPGTYHWILRAVTGGEEVTLKGEFACEPSSRAGFVRISKSSPRLFEFSNGEFYYPIGHNLRSLSDQREGVYRGDVQKSALEAEKLGIFAFERWFTRMRENDENFARVWMCSWWLGLEWNAKTPSYNGLAYYNQENAARLDRLIAMAEQRGIYINLETFNHGALSTYVDHDWEQNPLSETQPGGFLRFATDFLYSDRARRLHEKRLRYTVARWGYSPAIAFWGVATESEWIEPYSRTLPFVNKLRLDSGSHVPVPYRDPQHLPAFRDWLDQTAGYLKQVDVHPHIVTTHFSLPMHGKQMWARDNIQIIHNNAYTMFTTFWRQDMFTQSSGVADVIYAYSDSLDKLHDKPLLLGEWGGHSEKNRLSHLVAELHTGLWAGYMTNLSGLTGFWWWNLIDARNLYSEFRAVAAFTKAEDLRGKKYSVRRAELSFTGGISSSLGNGRQGLVRYNALELFAYIYDQSINTHDQSIIPDSFEDRRFPLSGKGQMKLPRELKNGLYQIEYWNTFEGKVIETRLYRVADSSRSLPVISHRVDLAIKMKPIKDNIS